MAKFMIASALALSASYVAAETKSMDIQMQNTNTQTQSQDIVDTPNKQVVLDRVSKITPPAGVTFVGSADMLKRPTDVKDKNMESWFGGLGLGGCGGFGGFGLGGCGGFGGLGPWRYGFMHGGVPGWAYPLSYWNMYGSGLYGGNCGLGLGYGGLFYC